MNKERYLFRKMNSVTIVEKSIRDHRNKSWVTSGLWSEEQKLFGEEVEENNNRLIPSPNRKEPRLINTKYLSAESNVNMLVLHDT